jgi:inner membrane protein
VVFLLYRTHLFLGAASGLLAAGQAHPKAALACAGIGAAAALLPDVDSPDSHIGRLIPVVPRVLKTVAGHRGPLHSAAAAFAFAVLALPLLGKVAGGVLPVSAAALAFLAGYFSHLAADSLNPAGVPWLWPLPFRLGIPLVQVGSWFERKVVVPGSLIFFACLCAGRFDVFRVGKLAGQIFGLRS